MAENTHLVLVSGKSATGKSACLAKLKDQEGVAYLNCENNKRLPFRNQFKKINVTTPAMVYQAFDQAEQSQKIHTIVVDTLTFLMDLYESLHVLTSANTMKAWGEYAQFLKILMSQKVANSTKNVIILAHTSDVMNESEMINETLVKVKGSIMNQGVEAFFSTVISTKKMPLTKLTEEVANSPYFTVTPEEEAAGFKYVFQTLLTKETVNERIRSPMGMWSANETFIDNDIQNVIDRLHEYYD